MTVCKSMPVICALIILLASPITAADLLGKTEGNVCKVEGHLDAKTKITVTMELSRATEPSMDVRDRVGADPAWRRDSYSVWGTWASLQRVLIEVNANPVRIPRNAFAGMYDVTNIRVSLGSKGSIQLRVDGGDAGESYLVTYRIVPSKRIKGQYRVADRVERVGEFPDEVWERTTYHNTIWDDPNM